MSESAEHVTRTYESEPVDRVRFSDGPGTFAEVDIDAAPEIVWDLVTDINLPARFSDELLSAEWESDGPSLGATFVGHNTHWAVGEWDVRLFVHSFEPGRTFGWCTSDPDEPGARWRFDVHPHGTGTRLRFSATLGPGRSGTTAAIAANPTKEDRIILNRITEVHTNITRTVEGIKALAEGAASDI